jgi:hypothetical protein
MNIVVLVAGNMNNTGEIFSATDMLIFFAQGEFGDEGFE